MRLFTIGLDVAKSVFQVHGFDDVGAVVTRKRVSRAKWRFFRKAAAMPHWYRGLSGGPPLGFVSCRPSVMR